MTKKSPVQMKDGTFFGKDSGSIIAFLPGFKAACNARDIHEGAAMCLFRHYLTGAVEAVFKAQLAFRTKTAMSKEGRVTSFSEIIIYLLNRFATDDIITTVDSDIRSFQQGSLTGTEYAQQLWMMTLSSGSVYNEKIFKRLFVEGVHP